ncbi:hypothetical protein ACFXHA_39085 [Nocardia sp. NPDC059240]|uniref:hypothetical protein n=1 Tax=Nocardia sp. NPDC059240 TaxID=3346786 RepID=UPI003688274F
MYRIIPDPDTAEQVAALPVDALLDYAQVLSVLEVSPWAGSPQNDANPDGAVRRWAFGPGKAGQVIYLVLEAQREVHLLMVQWLG